MKSLQKSNQNHSPLPFSHGIQDMLRSFDDAWDLFHNGLDHWLSDRGISRINNVEGASFVPSINYKEEEDSFSIDVELPGMDVDDVDVSVRDNVLVIAGEKKSSYSEKDDEGKSYYYESSYGSFHRELRLPENIDTNTKNLSATMKNGILSISVPKLRLENKKDKVKKVEVKREA